MYIRSVLKTGKSLDHSRTGPIPFSLITFRIFMDVVVANVRVTCSKGVLQWKPNLWYIM